MEIKIPEFCLIVLIGASGSGKSSFAKKHFKATEILSSDTCRAWVSDDENDQSATKDAFDVLYEIASKRLQRKLLTVIDATNVQKEARKGFIELAKKYHALPLALVLNVPENVCEQRNKVRKDRNLGGHVLRQQSQQLRQSLSNLRYEGFRQIHILDSVKEIDEVTAFRREKLYNDKKDEKGPFDIIGDVHGCIDELVELLHTLGYEVHSVPEDTSFGYSVTAPVGRRVIFVGDLVDRGPDSPAVLRLVMSMVHAGIAFCVVGNHDFKLQKYLSGKKVSLKHGLEVTVDQLKNSAPTFIKAVEQFLYNLVSHYIFDDGRLVVAHAGIKEEMQGRASGAVRSFCMFGETNGEIDEFGLPVRLDWAKDYRGNAFVVYGHTPVPEAEWVNRTIDIDTGCVFGGKLTALRYPEEELLSVPAKAIYCEPKRPLNYKEIATQTLNPQQNADELLDIKDVLGKRIIQTSLKNNITIKEENAIAALEVMSRFAVNPKWLIYLPPTMSPCSVSSLDEYLEHPLEALQYYKKRGITKVVCEEKHMGSRAVLIICKNQEVVKNRFGIEEEGVGICYTRSGRNFFSDAQLEKSFLERVRESLHRSGFWETYATDWVCFDIEIMPWSAKAQGLIKDQYAAVGTAAKGGLQEVLRSFALTQDRGFSIPPEIIDKFSMKSEKINKYIKSYAGYCWNVNSLEDYKIAPFHMLATEGGVHLHESHEWHLNVISKVATIDPEFIIATKYKCINLEEDQEVESLVQWWESLTERGGEGMVVKPYSFLAMGKEGVLQPAIKCRGKEYLRIIYGPDYDSAENLSQLKKRGISKKRSLALREFALGIEGLERFVNKEPLWRIHEPIFGVLALESEEVDPRL